ncbi:MAG: flagellar hook-length control protein FliK [Woeseiaceae bacterium]
MLQGLNLPFIEISPVEPGLNYSVSLQGQGVEPDTIFADIFRLEPEGLPSLQPATGNPLPPAGNVLPHHLSDLPVASLVEDFEADLLQPEVPATNPLAVAAFVPISTPIQISLATGGSATPAPTPVAAAASPQLPISTPAPVTIELAAQTPALNPPQSLTPILQGAMKSHLEGRANVQAVQERANLVLTPDAGLHRPTPGPESSPLRVATELPVLPISGEAIANVLEQSAQTKKVPTSQNNPRLTAESADLLKPVTEAPRDNNGQSIKPTPTSTAPLTTQFAPIAPVANNNGDVVQQIQVSPLQLSPVVNRVSAETNIAPPPTLGLIDTPVNESAWGDRVGDRLLLMASNKMQSAEIRLSPAELGPLRVRIAVDDGIANVNFNAQHAATREALEQAMPRLRELFAENGLTLQQSNIAESDGHGVQQGKHDQENAQATADAAAASMDEESDADSATTELILKPRSDKLVDTFA